PSAVSVSGAELVLCQLEIPIETVRAIAQSASGLLCVNTAPARSLPAEVLERADLLIMNESERDALSEEIADVHALVVVTLGAAGAKAYRSGHLVAEAQPPPVEVVDTVGAGDAFCGALVTALLSGGSIASALKWACSAGALATTRPGAQPSLPLAAEIDAVMRR
ncbi:MAG: PfkB family carbohydrate kinase, partial [Acidimicrobiia bacterium]